MKKLFLLLVLAILMVPEAIAAEPESYEQVFPDPNFAAMVASATGRAVSDPVIQGDLDRVLTLRAPDGDEPFDLFDLTGIGRLKNLREIALPGLHIANIPQEIGNLTALKKMDFRDNQIVHVAEEIGRLPGLEELYLDHNKIGNLPDFAEMLPNLKAYTAENQDLSTGNVPVTFLPNCQITYDAQGAPRLTEVYHMEPPPEHGVELGGNLADEDPALYEAMNNKMMEIVDSLPVFYYEDAYTAREGATVQYVNDGKIGHVRGDFDYTSTLDQYRVGEELPDGRYIGNYSEFSISSGPDLMELVREDRKNAGAWIRESRPALLRADMLLAMAMQMMVLH